MRWGEVDTAEPGLQRDVVEPFGLGGWSWGAIRLRDVSFDPQSQLIGGTGTAWAHSSGTSPAAGRSWPPSRSVPRRAHDLVAATLSAKLAVGGLRHIRDNALITLGRTQAEITADLLSVRTASRLASADHPDAERHARLCKAAGVDAAYRAVTDLAPLVGATGLRRGTYSAGIAPADRSAS